MKTRRQQFSEFAEKELEEILGSLGTLARSLLRSPRDKSGAMRAINSLHGCTIRSLESVDGMAGSDLVQHIKNLSKGIRGLAGLALRHRDNTKS
jgi:hypothetical protein